MHTIAVRNVNYALPEGIQLIRQYGKSVSPRDQATLEIPEPVSTVYERPQERVLFRAERDINPFLFLFESLWVLGGRNDAAFVAQFNARMASYSDNGETFHAAYGYRLRHHFGMDQLTIAVDRLRKDPTTRQVVLQIWSAKDDLGCDTKDLPCNDTIALKVRQGALNMTVFCRSNDISWGAYGANAVQFSVLLEYLAAQIGVSIGVYTQVSDSFHAYVEREDWKRIERLGRIGECPYSAHLVCPWPLIDVPSYFDRELQQFLNDPANDLAPMFPKRPPYRNSFFWKVAIPMYRAWEAHKEHNNGLNCLRKYFTEEVKDEKRIDWLEAAHAWLERREGHAPRTGIKAETLGPGGRGRASARPRQVRRQLAQTRRRRGVS